MEKTPLPRSEFDLECEAGVGTFESSDVPMFEMTIKVFGWERGQAEIDTRFFDVLGKMFDAASPDGAEAIFTELHTRLQEETAEAFEIFRRCPPW